MASPKLTGNTERMNFSTVPRLFPGFRAAPLHVGNVVYLSALPFRPRFVAFGALGLRLCNIFEPTPAINFVPNPFHNPRADGGTTGEGFRGWFRDWSTIVESGRDTAQ